MAFNSAKLCPFLEAQMPPLDEASIALKLMLSTSYFLYIARFHHMNPKEMIRKYTYLVVHFNISELNNFIKNGSHPSV
jgi:hypothetical protein